MRRDANWPLIAIDLLGSALVAACLAVFTWATLWNNQRLEKEIVTLRQTIAGSQQALATLQGVRDRQRTEAARRHAELAQRGRLPAAAPLEEYFQVLSGLAARHRLSVIGQTPSESRSYPGLLEQCFTYEVAGTTGDLLRFLREIEETGYWADVSYLKIDEGRSSGEPTVGRRVAALTVSLFSSPPAAPKPLPPGAPPVPVRATPPAGAPQSPAESG
ncbi:MAG: hypothetical protein HY763_08635 [Planctomycetes bacterium]|nr:hypothetical protein [Planctomycetota bacterium]